MSVIPNLSYRFNAMPLNIPVSSFLDIDKLTFKFIWISKRLRIVNKILKAENSVGRQTQSSLNPRLYIV